MSVDQEHCRAVFQKLSTRLSRVNEHSGPDAIHKFRTSTRRVETVIQELRTETDRSARKLLKILRRLRRKAGRVRDLDAQIGLLKNLKIAHQNGQKSQLLRTLVAERVKKEKKFAEALSKDVARELQKRLARAGNNLEIPQGVEPLNLALRTLSEVTRDHSPLTEATIHQYRLAGKRARYLIEIASKDPVAEAFNESLRKMQDVVGDWHDWSTLTERAEELFGGVKDSALVAAMRNLTRAKFRESVDAVVRTRAMVSGKKAGSPVKPEISRRQPSTELQTTSAA
ncbi:MAG: CHAD domain-containing protein [Terriglobales bacterium]